mgnify:CR=1 FL=1
MNLLYLIPGVMGDSKLGEEEMQRRCAILNQFAFPGTEVDVWDAHSGPQSIESLTEEYESIPGTVRRAVEAELAAGTLYPVALTDCRVSHEFTFLWRKDSAFEAELRQVSRQLWGEA